MPRVYLSNTVREAVFLQSTDQVVLSTINPVPPFGTTNVNDFASFANGTQIAIIPLAAGDIVSDIWFDVVTPIVGPTGTPTMSIGVTGTATQFVAANSVLAVGTYINTGTGANYVATTATNIIVDFEAGGGNGAAATAGLIKIYANIVRYRDRNSVQG